MKKGLIIITAVAIMIGAAVFIFSRVFPEKTGNSSASELGDKPEPRLGRNEPFPQNSELENLTRALVQQSQSRLVSHLKPSGSKPTGLPASLLFNLARSSAKGIEPRLKEILSQAEPGSFEEMALACALFRAGDLSVKPILEDWLKNPAGSGKIPPAETLAHGGDEQGLDELLEVIKGEDWGLRLQALRALGYFQSPQARQVLSRYSTDSDLWTRIAANAGLALQGQGAAQDFLANYLESADPAIRIYCAETLAELSDLRAKPVFEKELTSPNPYEQVHGSAYLLLYGDDQGLSLLENALQTPGPLGDYAASLCQKLFP